MSIYNAVYSGIPVYEMMMRNVAVMRRTKILEKEVQIGEHEKVQGGYGKYQGTWSALFSYHFTKEERRQKKSRD